MGGEGDVVELDGGREPVVAEGVLLADYGGVVEGPVREEVCEEACSRFSFLPLLLRSAFASLLGGWRFGTERAGKTGPGEVGETVRNGKGNGGKGGDIPSELMKGKSIVVPRVDLRL